MYDVSDFLAAHDQDQPDELAATIYRYLDLQRQMDKKSVSLPDSILQSQAHEVVMELINNYGFTPGDIETLYDNADVFWDVCKPPSTTSNLKVTA